MDYARKIGKSEEPKKWVRQLPRTVSAHDNLISRDRTSGEDRRLVNWRKWLAKRRKQYDHIEAYTGRHSSQQIMNSCETIRPLVEMRTLMDYANTPVPVVPDKYRGGPEFWRLPLPLKNHLPDVKVTPSKKELNIAPELANVELPELIEKEKGLVCLKSREPLWKRSEYLMKRKRELSKEIELITPKEPELRDLVIRGHGPFPKRIVEPRIPPITIFSPEEVEGQKDSGDYPDQSIVLKIQDREIVWQRHRSGDEQTDPITWNVFFSSTVNCMTEGEIVFENKGNCVIVYEWRAAPLQSERIPLKRQFSPFFFNKTKEVIPPGQIVKLKIWYRQRVAGVFREMWRLQTYPKLCSSPLIFRLWGCARKTKLDMIKSDTVFLIDKYLDLCVRNTVIRDIINAIIESIHKREPFEPAYGSLFLESEIFVTRNPLCFYNPSVLMEFHNIYYAVTNQNEKRWNLSLNDLRDVLLKVKQSETRHDMLKQFSQLYKECLRPTLQIPVEYNKYEAVRGLLSSFFNRFEVEHKYARGACFVKECDTICPLAGVSTTRMNTASQVSFKSNESTRLKTASQASFSSSAATSLNTASEASLRNSDARNRIERKSSTRLLSFQMQEAVKSDRSVVNNRLYAEVFFIRIHELLSDTMERILATIESFDNINERDK